VALDATPLLGRPTGVGAFCAGALGGLAGRDDVAVAAFAVSWRRRHELTAALPPGVRRTGRAMPARPLHAAWRHLSVPPVEWFTGPLDVVHGTNFVVPPARSAARVVTVHDLTVVRFPELCDPPTLRYPRLLRRAIDGGAWIHTPSSYVAGEVVELLGASPDRVRAVHSGIPVDLGPRRDERNGAPVTLPATTTRYVLALGTAEPRKDLPGLVAAFDRIAGEPAASDVALVLAGPDGWGTDALDAAVAEAGNRDRIVRTGWVPDDVRHRLVAGAAVLAYPSLYEGFGFPPLEAMAAGVPVVATRAGALPEVLGDDALLVPPRDRDALAAALLDVVRDLAVRAAWARRSTARAARYSWDRCAEGLAALYRDAAHEAAS
jgi:glycosyltransferase involved in cell wall biosynthesis